MRNLFTLLLTGFCLSLPALSLAQALTPTPADTAWRHAYRAGLNLTQSAISTNWKAGGTNALALAALFEGKSEYHRAGWGFTGAVEAQYGLVRAEGQSLRKNADRLWLDAQGLRQISGRLSAFAGVNFTSQFAPGYRYGTDAAGNETRTLISNFAAPAFITQSLGLEYRPAPWVRVLAGLLTARQTIVTDGAVRLGEPANYGVAPGETVRNEFASQLTIEADKDIFENVNLKARAWAFYNYTGPERTDARLDLTLTGKVNRWLSMSLTAAMLYDADQDARAQWFQTLGAGLLYNF